MIGRSIQYKFYLFIGVVLISMGLSIFFISDIYMKDIIDVSQKALYEERVGVIIDRLKRSHERLVKTELIDVYKSGFMESAIRDLKKSYYKNGQKVYPAICDSTGAIVMHPSLEFGDKTFINEPFVKTFIEMKNGEVYYSFRGEKWALFRYFREWDWIVIYGVPLEVKYENLYIFRQMLLVIIVIVVFLVIVTFSFFVRKTISPILKLTSASREMANGNLEYPLDVDTNDEVGVLSDNFVRMRDSIKSNIVELNRTKSYLSNVINSMPSVLIGIDKHGNIINMNAEAQKFCGVDLDDAVGKSMTDVFPHFSELLSEMKETIHNRIPIEKEKIQHEVNGELRIANMTTYPLITNGIEGAVIRIDDVTEKTRLEQMMVQTEKMMSVGGLAAGMAHEINNPLASIIQGAQNITRRVSPEFTKNKEIAKGIGVDIDHVDRYMQKREIHLFLKGINEAGIRAAEIVKNMLNFSRQSEGAVQSERVSLLLDEALELASHDYDLRKKFDFKKIEIVKSYENEQLTVNCVKSEIEQVILNLLKNGAEIMSEKSQNEKSKKDGYLPAFHIRTYKRKKRVYIEIEDNGPGMDEVTKKRVFEPFYTTKPVGRGTGLGLSVSYFIISQNHKGNMWVESEEGKGAKFVIELPIKS